MLRRLPAGAAFDELWRQALSAAAFVAVMAGGVLLGRAMLSPSWSNAVTLIGMGTLAAVLLLRPPAGLLVWILLAPYAEYIYLKLSLGSGIPDLDISRLALLLLGLRLVSQVTVENLARPSAARYRLAPFTVVEGMWLAFMVTISLSVRPTSQINTALPSLADYLSTPLLMYYLAPAAFCFFARNWLRSERALMTVLAVVAVGSVLLSAISVREQLSGLTLFSPRAGGIQYEGTLRKVLSVFGAPGVMTTTLSVTLPGILLGMGRARTPRAQVAFGAALIATLAGIFFVYVRAGWLGGLIGLAGMALFSPRMRRVALRALPVVVILSVLLVGVVISPQVVQSRISSEAPIAYRLIAWRIAWDLFRSSPLLGVGFNAFSDAAAQQYGWSPHEVAGLLPTVHNSYLFVLTSGGLLAILPYLGIFGALLWRGWRFWQAGADRELVAALWATVLVYMFISVTLESINVHYNNVLLFLILGTLLGRLEAQSEAAR